MNWLWKGALIVFLLVGGVIGAFLSVANSNSTDCFAAFPTKREAERVVDKADALGLDDSDLIVSKDGSAAIRISSGETGDDAAEFRQTVRRLVGERDRRVSCNERPYFN